MLAKIDSWNSIRYVSITHKMDAINLSFQQKNMSKHSRLVRQWCLVSEYPALKRPRHMGHAALVENI